MTPVNSSALTPFKMAPGGQISLSIVVPAYNEADNLVPAIDAIIANIPPRVTDFEIIIVDDGSIDGTASILDGLSAANRRIRVITHEVNQGKGAALKSGFHEAGMEWILFTDADCQIDFTELPKLFSAAEQYNIAVGFRHSRDDSYLRRFASLAYSLLIRIALNVRVKDVNCPLKLFPRDIIQSLELVSSGFFIDTEIVSLVNARGYTIGEVAVASKRRHHGSSSVRIYHVYETLAEICSLFLRMRATKRNI